MTLAAATIALGPSWLDPDFLIQSFGLLGILFIVWAESGLLIGLFLPGDSLLFTAGLLIADGRYLPPLYVTIPLIGLAAFLGDQTGYWIGRRAGPAIFKREQSRFFDPAYVERAHAFFEKYGARTVVIARFVPIVRTFVPTMAGASRMHYRTFAIYNVVGALLWGIGVTMLGYWLGQFTFVKDNIELMLLFIVFLSVLPMIFEGTKAYRSSSRRKPQPSSSADSP
ncbi:hypothetical protein BH24ACT11_BH24ACT11_19660 [soil metagenome]|nr:VTT domain-containing protein [Actinomycetota bacterium]